PPANEPIRSAGRNRAEIRLDLVPDLEIIQRLLRGLELVRLAVRRRHRDLAGLGIQPDHPPLDLLGRGGLRLIARGLGLSGREPRPERDRDHDAHCQCPVRLHELLQLLGLRDVVDGAGGGAHARPDEGALAGPVSGSGTNRGSRTGADRGAAQRSTRRRGERDQRQADHGRCDPVLHGFCGHGSPPAVLLATCVPASWRTTPRVDSGNWEPGRWRFTPAEKKVHSRRRKNYPRTEKEPMGQLEGKVALITGASKGIGRVMSRLFAEEGAAVVCGARSRDLVEETAALIKGAGGRAVALTGDAATEGDVQKMVAAAVTAFGKLDVLVNNAGDGGPTKRVQEYTTDDWFYTINSCLTS